MYPTVIAGLVLVAAAVMYAARPDPRRRQVVRALAMLTFLVSCLGFVCGVIRAFGSAAEADVGSYAVAGVGESLNNIALGLCLLVIAGIATAIGAYRTGPRAASGAAELHGL